jgi:hypothetical protein
MEKGVFPYNILRVSSRENIREEVIEILNRPIESVTQSDFFDSLKNKPFSDKDWKRFKEDSANFKSIGEYLRFYNIRDVEVMINPTSKLMEMLSKNGIDMLHYLSGS